MLSDTAALYLSVAFMIASLVVLVWWVTRVRKLRQAHKDGSQPGMLYGFLVLAAFAMGAFLTYALLGLR